MTATAAGEKTGRWFPRLLGGGAFLLLAVNAADLLYTPAESAEQVLLGLMFRGRAAQLVTGLHILFFALCTWGALARKAFMVWVASAYFVYLAVALWVWTALHGQAYAQFPTATILTNVLVTLLLLVLCRVTFGRRAAFDQ
jgi:hypothetical protein